MEEEEDAGGTKGRAVLSCARGERERARGGRKVDIYAAQEWPCLKDHDGWKHFKPIDLNNRSMVAAAPATFLARVTSHPFVFPPRRRLSSLPPVFARLSNPRPRGCLRRYLKLKYMVVQPSRVNFEGARWGEGLVIFLCLKIVSSFRFSSFFLSFFPSLSLSLLPLYEGGNEG